jgi:7,8-dihydropterin-6-yl-methyl-4-(beta-D-ribofuranosyl)aminobenzene 5'-phosphate synthase
MNSKITIICENRACITDGITGEHGFSALIETNTEKLLLDTGQGLSLVPNAQRLGIRLDDISNMALSHGHYDHTGGLEKLPTQKHHVTIHAHPDVFSPKYSVKTSPDGDTYKFIGMNKTQKELESALNARFAFTTRFTPITDQIFFSGEIPRITDFEKTDTRLLVKAPEGYLPDPLLDDASLLIETGSGPVIVTGCAHSGIVNVMEHFSKQTGHKTFYAVIGGTHLGFLNSPDQLEKTMDAFDRFQIQLLAVSHCTGNEAAAVCYNRFKERFAFANAGWQLVC